MMSSNRPIRILHVLGAFNQGGVETWLLNLLKHIDREQFQIDFLVHTTTPAAYDDDIRRLGSRILYCPYPRRPWKYAHQFKRITRDQHGAAYDVVHSHVHDFSGFVLRLASQAGVPVRIAHSHLDSSITDQKSGFLRRQYLKLMKRWIHQYANLGLGCSRRAAASLFGRDWQCDPRWKLLYCGVDLQPYEGEPERTLVRSEFNISAEETVIGHVGRFSEQKNHRWMVDFLIQFAKARSASRLLLIGDGPLRSEIEERFRAAGLIDRVIFTGPRRDVPRLMNAMDAFLLPSHFEGLPIAVLEAQAAGLPCLISDVVDSDAMVVQSLVHRLSLAQPIADWVHAAVRVCANSPASTREEALTIVSQSPFNIHVGVENLERLYREQLNRPTTDSHSPELTLTR